MHNDKIATATSIDDRGVCNRRIWIVGVGKATRGGGKLWGDIEGTARGKSYFERHKGGGGGRRGWQRCGGLRCRIVVATSAFALADWTDVVVVFVLNRPELHHGIGMRRRHCGR